MGIDKHVLNFIRYTSRKQTLGRVATIGRQGILEPRAYAQYGPYCEELLKRHFGATSVDSFDYSDYEGATNIVDMNEPIVTDKQYDTVLDLGSIEHVYNAPQALMNVSRLCAPSGQIVHVLPANNFCGHGFWQFSPELFFSLYAPANGYDQTDVFLADLTNPRCWFEVKRPANGIRAEVLSRSPVYVMCRTVRTGEISHSHIQQSDYVNLWKGKLPAKAGSSSLFDAVKRRIKRTTWLYIALLSAQAWFTGVRFRRIRPLTLSGRNPHLNKRRVSDLLTRIACDQCGQK